MDVDLQKTMTTSTLRFWAFNSVALRGPQPSKTKEKLAEAEEKTTETKEKPAKTKKKKTK